MEELGEDTLFEVYMANTKDDIGAIKFINSPECTVEMVNYDNGDGWCPLNLAARLNRHEVVDALIKKGADVNQVSWDSSMNALMYAICDGDYYEQDGSKLDNLKTIELLVNAGTNLNFEDRTSAFLLACELNKTEVIALLLAHKINIDFKDEDGNTSMTFLRERNNNEGIRLVENYMLKESLQKELPNELSESKKPKM